VTKVQRAKGDREKKNKGYHRLIVWQKAKELVFLVYKYSDNFPRAEEFGLKSQLRRAAVSVVLNIVEGHRRRSTKEFLRFIDIAWSSLTEVEAILEIALELGYLKDRDFELLEDNRAEIAYLLNGLVKSLKIKIIK